MRAFLTDPDVTLYHGDALTVLQQLPAESVHMCVTSPPFYGLRDYGTGRWEGGNPDCDHMQDARGRRDHSGDNFYGTRGEQDSRAIETPYRALCGKCGARRVDQQIGLEETPEQWVASLVAVFREVRRVLRDDGTLWLEVGDSYAGSGKGPSESLSKPHHNLSEIRGPIVPSGCKPKDLIGAPWQLAFALRADGWYLRSDIVWARPNPMPESVTDRPTKSHSYVFLLSKQPRYFFDAEAVREGNSSPEQYEHNQRYAKPYAAYDEGRAQDGQPGNVNSVGIHARPGGVGRNVRSVWNIATQPYPEAHFATFPEELARRCILAGTSERGCCPECGAPWIRVTETELVRTAKGNRVPTAGPRTTQFADANDQGANRQKAGHKPGWRNEVTTLGWRPSCDCACETDAALAPVSPVVVLDPFVGSGTVPYVARKHGRHGIGIDLKVSYLELAARRLQQQSLFTEAAR